MAVVGRLIFPNFKLLIATIVSVITFSVKEKTEDWIEEREKNAMLSHSEISDCGFYSF